MDAKSPSNVRPKATITFRFRAKSIRKTVDKIRALVTEDVRRILQRCNVVQFLDIPPFQQNVPLLSMLLSLWIKEEEAFLIKGCLVKFTAEDVALIVGMPNRGWKVNVANLPTLDKRTSYDYSKDLEGISSAASAEEFAIVFLKFLISNVFFRNTNIRIASAYINYGNSVEDFPLYNWPEAIHSFLIMQFAHYGSRREENYDSCYLGGFLTIVVIWFLEHFFVQGAAFPERRPRMLRWSSQIAWNEAEVEGLLDNLDATQIFEVFQHVNHEEEFLLQHPHAQPPPLLQHPHAQPPPLLQLLHSPQSPPPPPVQPHHQPPSPELPKNADSPEQVFNTAVILTDILILKSEMETFREQSTVFFSRIDAIENAVKVLTSKVAYLEEQVEKIKTKKGNVEFSEALTVEVAAAQILELSQDISHQQMKHEEMVAEEVGNKEEHEEKVAEEVGNNEEPDEMLSAVVGNKEEPEEMVDEEVGNKEELEEMVNKEVGNNEEDEEMMKQEVGKGEGIAFRVKSREVRKRLNIESPYTAEGKGKGKHPPRKKAKKSVAKKKGGRNSGQSSGRGRISTKGGTSTRLSPVQRKI